MACAPCALNGGLRWWWSLNAATGGAAHDCSGLDRSGVCGLDSVDVVTGAYGQGWSVRGSAELVAPEAALKRAQRTLTFHALPTDSGAQTLYEERAGETGLRITVAVQAAQATYQVVTDEPSGSTVRASLVASSSQFTFLSLSRDATDQLTFRAGDASAPAGAWSASSTSAAFHPRSAREPGAGAVIDEVRVFERLLTTSDFGALRGGACAESVFSP